MTLRPLTRLALATSSVLLVLSVSPAVPAAETYEVDPVHSMVFFRVKHLGVAYFYGHFNEISGSVVVDEENPAASRVELTIPAASIETHNEKRDQHLKSPDFFNAKQFPVITFRSTGVKRVSETDYEVSGELSLHGVTRPLTVTVERAGAGADPWGGYRSGFETSFTIKRSDFGMTYMLGGLSDEVFVSITVEGIRS